VYPLSPIGHTKHPWKGSIGKNEDDCTIPIHSNKSCQTHLKGQSNEIFYLRFFE
jgi:hypothetical protein